jgi:hypothetical protein
MKKILFLFVCLSIGYNAVGQYVTLNDSLESFGTQVAALLASTNNAEAEAFGQDFNALWPNTFSTDQQQQIVDLAIQLQDRKMRSIPYQRDFFGALTLAVNLTGLSGSKLDNFLSMLSKSLDNNPPRKFARELVNLRIFFEFQALHRSSYNSLYALNADYDFEFVRAEEYDSYSDQPIEESQEGEDDGWGSDTDDGWGNSEDDGWGGDNEDSWANENQDPWADDPVEDTNWEIDENTGMLDGDFESFAPAEMEISIPSAEGAVINFAAADLVMATNYDSTIIKGTKGMFLLDKYLFVGEGGRFDWSSAGIDPAEVYVDFDQYSFNTRNPFIEAANVHLTYTQKLMGTTKGAFEFKSLRRTNDKEPRYPKFISYSSNNVLENLGSDNLTYKGGIALEGKKLLGVSAYNSTSTMKYGDAEGKKFKTISKLFQFEDSVITSYNSSVVIYHGRDSIYHPSVKARYYVDENRFVAIKDKNGYNLTPFNATYFNMSISADAIKWALDSDSLNISIMNARSMLPAYFKSKEYYDFAEIKELTGVYNFNPLLVAYSYGVKVKSREFYISDLISDLKLNDNAVRGAMKHLLYLDFIEYDEMRGRIYLKDKALHFVRAKNNRTDYDDLMIPSLSTELPNATLKLPTNELVIRGIDRFFINEVQDVYIYPENQEINLLKNRDFKFDGQLFAGNFEFVGREFTFRYDSFLVDLQRIDSIRLYIEMDRRKRRQPINSKLVSSADLDDPSVAFKSSDKSRGTLYINRPDNKSGRRIFPQYPIFEATQGAVVYFDEPETLGGAYDKSVYFLIPPFAIDSLSSSDPATIGFDGTFVSGNILPSFDQRLQIMPDRSLGFEHTLPQDGLDVYGGPGRIYNKITLDQNGIVGNGKIDYLSSSSYAENYTFYLDSVTADGTNFKLNEGDFNGTDFPDIYADNFEMKWLPYDDHMYVRNKLDSFKLYNNTAYFDGEIDLTTTGVNGAGIMATRGFESQSEDFTFSQFNVEAKHSMFTLQSDNQQKPLLSGNDIRLNFDFARDVADISPEIEGMAALDFPFAQFKSSISNAQWNLQEQKVYMTKLPDVDIENSYFYATREELDSLAFNAESAVYDIETSQLKVSGIPYIIVADAMVTPENNEVLIFENAQIGELYNTTIVIDTLNEYHRLIDGTIQINSRQNFTGDATYEFVNAMKDTFNIKFGKFELWKDEKDKKATLQTVSSGFISENERLKISEGMFYKGDVTMYARNRALELDGYVQLDLKSRNNTTNWIKYNSMDEETQDVQFNFNQAVTEQGEGLTAGLHFGSLNSELYVTFAEDKRLDSDIDFFAAEGIFRYDPQKGMFMVEDTSKVNGNKFSGKVFGYNDETGDIAFEGPLKFVESSDDVSLAASGFGNGNVNELKYEVNSLLKIDYNLPGDALALMAADVFEVIENFGAPEAENDPDAFLYKISEFIGERATLEYDSRSQQDYLPITTFSPRMTSTLLFSKVLLEWSPVHKAWYSKDRLGLSSIVRNDINALIDGFIEIKTSPERGTIINIFMQASSDCWYYFGYEDNRLVIFSSNDEFIDIIAAKSNIHKAGFGEYAFVDADLPDVLKFVDRFRLDYLGISDPYEIRMPVQEVADELDILEIPVDNSEDGDLLPMEIEDNTEESLGFGEDELVDDVSTEEELINELNEDEELEDEPKTEEDLLNPVEETTEEEEEDDEGF